MKQITVLLADDHTIVREGFRKMLEMEKDIDVVGEAEDGRQAVALAKKLRPDVVLMDIAMPLLNGLEATRQLLKAMPTARVLMLSAHSDDAYVTSATACRPSSASPTTSMSFSNSSILRKPSRTMVWSSASRTETRSLLI